MSQKTGDPELDEALDRLEQDTPDRMSRAIRWLRNPNAKWVRIPLGLFFVVCSFLWFLPVVGIEFLPLGLLLLAIDIPALRRPVARLTLWLERKWRHLRDRFGGAGA